MNEIERAAAELAHFFARHNIETDGLTIILNIGDREAAARLDYAIKSSFKAYELYPGGPVGDIRQFQLRGVKFKVESPLHAP